ncbi:unnamed protein product [Xylocopa violacea]|uniref:Uncharacterized protein n=1 Tax=Xylocopa violacea TaxID=135666 RepID=A0ABP1P8P3_XYLVO
MYRKYRVVRHCIPPSRSISRSLYFCAYKRLPHTSTAHNLRAHAPSNFFRLRTPHMCVKRWAAAAWPVNVDRANRKQPQTALIFLFHAFDDSMTGHMVGRPPVERSLWGSPRASSMDGHVCAASQINLLALTLPVFIVFTHHVPPWVNVTRLRCSVPSSGQK